MSLLQDWHAMAYNEKADKNELTKLWNNYFQKEKNFYEILLSTKDSVISGSVKELADRFAVDIMTMTGIIDGINDSLITPNPIDEMTEDTMVSFNYDKEKLYMNMVDAKADWLYNLPQWNDLLDEKKRHELYLIQKKSGTIVKEKKIGRNDPCPCGSGKKYKKCCGK